jgi:hypothetical protein
MIFVPEFGNSEFRRSGDSKYEKMNPNLSSTLGPSRLDDI